MDGDARCAKTLWSGAKAKNDSHACKQTHVGLHAPIMYTTHAKQCGKGTSPQHKYFFRPTELAHLPIAGLARDSMETKLGLFELYHVQQTQPTTMTRNSSGQTVPLYVEGENMFRSDTVPCYSDASNARDTTWWYYEKKASSPSQFVRLENVSLTSGTHHAFFLATMIP